MTNYPDNSLQVAQTNLQLYKQLADIDWSPEKLERLRGAYELATTRFAGLLRPNGKCFLAHLVGTASITAQHGGDTDFTLVALLHAWRTHAYHRFRWCPPGLRGSFPRQLAPVLRDGIELYETMHRRLRHSLPTVDDIRALSTAERLAVLVHIANELEDFVDHGMAYRNSGPTSAKATEQYIDGLCTLAEGIGKPALAMQLREIVTTSAGYPASVTLKSTQKASYAPAHQSASSVLHRWPGIASGREPAREAERKSG
ncbi:MAG: hypothetical protein AB8B57_09160 [Congregibacter sp.]